MTVPTDIGDDGWLYTPGWSPKNISYPAKSGSVFAVHVKVPVFASAFDNEERFTITAQNKKKENLMAVEKIGQEKCLVFFITLVLPLLSYCLSLLLADKIARSNRQNLLADFPVTLKGVSGIPGKKLIPEGAKKIPFRRIK